MRIKEQFLLVSAGICWADGL